MEILSPEELSPEALALVSADPPQLLRARTTESVSAVRAKIASMSTTLGLPGFGSSYEMATRSSLFACPDG